MDLAHRNRWTKIDGTGNADGKYLRREFPGRHEVTVK
jgi:hypothetical protein